MSMNTRKPARPACWPGLLLHFVCAAILASGLLSLPAGAQTVSNTASVSYIAPDGPVVRASNAVAMVTIPAPTPSVLRFYQYAPGVTGASALPFDGGEYYDATTGTFVMLPAPQAIDGTPFNLASPLEVRETGVFHVGEPVFVVLTDANRNLDPSVREVIELQILTSTGDVETLRMLETGPDTGVYSTVIATVGAAVGVTQNDGRLTLGISTRLTGDYQDIWYPFDTSEADALVDPFGIVFDAETGAPVDGVLITMVDVATGLPATVFGDDGTSAFPATLQTGGSAVDSSGFTYTFPPGGFRFPFVAPGNYRFVLQVPAGYTAPSTILPANLPDDPDGVPYAITTGSYGEEFVVVPGPALNIDVPIDPQRRTLALQKAVSQQEASAGDFLQYRLTLQNIDTAFAVSAIDITDRLPFGLAYQEGSLRVDGMPQPDPVISADRRTLTIPVGDLAASASLQVTYVVMVGAGTPVGDAVNEASAAGDSGRRLSNLAQAAVRIREPLFSGRFTIIGRVFEGECSTPWHELKGVPNVRILMEDGTYVVTDDDGQYHFEGVRPGTHVVQLDTDSLAPTQEPVSCIDNTRFGGTPHSQFVDVKGGGLWRADFHVRKRVDDVGIRVGTRLETVDVPVPVPAPVPAVVPVSEPKSFFVEFDDCRAELNAAAQNVISRVVSEHAAADVARIEVIGHTDSRPLSRACAAKFRDNHGLSAERARAAGDALARELGLPPEEVNSEGRGPDQPVASNRTAEGRARNRRTEGRLHLKAPEPVVVAGDSTANVPHRTAVAGIAHDIEVDGSGPVRDLRVLALLPDGYVYDASSTQVDGVPMAPPAIDGALLTFELGEVPSARPWRRVISFRVVPATAAPAVGDAVPVAPASRPVADCPAGGYQVKALANVQPVTSDRTQTPAAGSQVACPAPAAADAPAGAPGATTIEHTGEREQVQIEGVRMRPVDPERAARRQARANIADTVTASGAHIDWFAGEQPGIAWRFPQPGYNPRSPASRIVIKHLPEQTVSLRRASGEPVSALSFEGVMPDATGTMAVSVWRAVSLEEGENRFIADVSDAGGALVQQVEGNIVYAGMPVRAELVPEQSVLVADGIDHPVVAVRLFDRDGNPVRHGVTGAFSVNAPFVSREQVERQQNRQLAGLDRFQPGWQVEGDDGIAYIELAPTSETGALILSFSFQTGLQGGGQYASRSQELRTWMEPAPRDWIVVGFAEGTLGHRTLKDNIQPLLAEGVDDGTWHDGQVSLYAKGRIRGEWLMTMAFDSDKRDERDRQKSLLSQIDPDEYYTLYGDGTEQRYDAPSQDRLYLKLERDQFYALFGDYETGLTQTQLSRYSRTLNGLKAEQGGGRVTFVMFAAETPQNFARDEIQGDGTSGLYRFTQGNIVLNSERIRIETRDRLQSQQIHSTRTLARHLDYDIDYSNGTVYFRQPVPSRDEDFNPVIIVAEYETLGVAAKELNAGGRIALALDSSGKAVLGVSAVRDEGSAGATALGGADLRVKLAADTELRVEAANTDGDLGIVSRDGEAWLAEVEHHSGRYDTLLYTRRQDAAFGVGQQATAESGQQKTGVDGQVRLTETWALQGELYNQQNLTSDDARDALMARLRYETAAGGFGFGGQVVEDRAGSGTFAGQTFRSEQATLMANRWFLDRQLELSAQADTALGGNRDSVDYPNRYVFGAGYAISRQARLLAGQEFTEGRLFDTSTTRAGIQVQPWTGARLESTLNQSRMEEYGPRTFGQYGLTQAVLVNERWGLDFSADASHTFNESAQQPLVVNPGQPVTPGGALNTTAVGVTEDFHAFSAGATYRAPLWSWNGRAETREGEITDRYGLVSNFLRQATAGVAFASSAKWFRTEQSTGMNGVLGSLDFSLAWRPLGVQWSVLNRTELKYESIHNGATINNGLFGNNSLLANDANTRRLINNLAVNRVSREWTGTDREGNLFNRYERNQWSLYYGAKYAMDTFDGVDYSGYTDLLGVEVRHDITPRWDVGVQASSLNSWKLGTHAYSFGPMVGWSPVKNGWITLGYNLRGFHDADFDAARYTAQGPYLQLRLKFDQHTRLWKKEEGDDAGR